MLAGRTLVLFYSVRLILQLDQTQNSEVNIMAFIGIAPAWTRITSYKPPKGGFINPKCLTQTRLNYPVSTGNSKLKSARVGLVVDSLTRFLYGAPIEKAFEPATVGCSSIDMALNTDINRKQATELLNNIHGIDDESISAAIKLAGYCGYGHSFMDVIKFKREGGELLPLISVTKDDIDFVRSCVENMQLFLKQYGPAIEFGVTFDGRLFSSIGYSGGYTKTIDMAEADLYTSDTLWDIKCSVIPPRQEHTFQLLVYWRMGLRSIHRENFSKLEYLGIMNPIKNKIYRYPICNISTETVEEIDRGVICYDDSRLNDSPHTPAQCLPVEDLPHKMIKRQLLKYGMSEELAKLVGIHQSFLEKYGHYAELARYCNQIQDSKAALDAASKFHACYGDDLAYWQKTYEEAAKNAFSQ